MPNYAHVENGTVIWERSYPDDIPQEVRQRKRIVPVVEALPPFDPDRQVLDGPVRSVEAGRVVDRYTVRPKTKRECDDDIRAARKAEYLRLGVDKGDFENTVGDVLDAVIKKVRALEAANTAAPEPEFDAMAAEIDVIKGRHPKP